METKLEWSLLLRPLPPAHRTLSSAVPLPRPQMSQPKSAPSWRKSICNQFTEGNVLASGIRSISDFRLVYSAISAAPLRLAFTTERKLRSAHSFSQNSQTEQEIKI